MPKISVIIPTFQHADTLGACLDSVFSQSFKDFEVIVVDDGSTDNTVVVLNPYLNRITYKKIENSGAPTARNTGFTLSKGEFVIFLDADVVMRPLMLEELYHALERNTEASYAYAGFRFGWKTFAPTTFSDERLKKVNFIHTSSLIRRADFPGFDPLLKKFQDWDLWLTLLAEGKRGVAVRKILFSVKPRRDGMSYWVPRFLYSSVISALGIRFKSVEKYNAALAVISKKHRLHIEPSVADSRLIVACFLVAFIVSAASYAHPTIGTVVGVVILLLAAMLSLRRLIFGVAILLAELLFGSLGGNTLALHIGDGALSLRIALFLTVLTVWVYRMIRGTVRKPAKPLVWAVAFMFAAVGWGVLSAISLGRSWNEIFFDANAYLALPLILIFSSAVETKQDQHFLRIVLRKGVLVVACITVAAAYFFGHIFPNAIASWAYKWLRDTRIAEVTALPSGVYRVFLQSQLFAIPALFLALLRYNKKGDTRWRRAIPPAFIILASLSRSFALAVLGGLGVVIAYFAKLRDPQSVLRVLARGFIAFTISALVFLVVLRFPLPGTRSSQGFQDLLRSREVSLRDAATASRWSLLPKLEEKIAHAPFLGSGFGTTVTYVSSDPRIVSSTGGTYTTSAFEWGYHDMYIKMGLFGLIALLFLLGVVLKMILESDRRERAWLLPSFAALVIVHAVSPYLNHPLGIGYLALLVALAETKGKKQLDQKIAVSVEAPEPATILPSPSIAMTEN